MNQTPYDQNYDYQGAYQNAINQYNQSAGNTQNYQNQLSNYRGSMRDPSQMYSEDLGNAQQMYGFNPQELLKAQKALATTNTTIANLPQAAQQQGNYYGTTAGAMANNLSQMGGNLQGLLAGQTNQVGAYQNILNATMQQANQQATLGLQGQQQQLGAFQNLVQNALAAQGISQQQEGVTQTQQTNYGAFLNAARQAAASEAQARAQQAQAAAAQMMAGAQSKQINQQVAQLQAIQNAFQQRYGNNWAAALQFAEKGIDPGTMGLATPAAGGNNLALTMAQNMANQADAAEAALNRRPPVPTYRGR